ncbi:MAG: thiolase domain-containing protein [Anaerolineales bacterium]|nr:thiolase domain-containing protein [Anaerolineales bacterium]
MKSTQPNDVLIAGVGITPVGEHWEKHLRELALDAIVAARSDAANLKPQALYVANMLAPSLSKQSQLGALVADFAGLRGVEAITVEAAGASGGVALRQAYLALITGFIDVALVVGVEKVTDRSSAEIEAALSTASDADYEAVHGVTATAQAALLMQRYLHEFDVPENAFAGFSLTAHANAVHNPNAMYRRAIDINAYSKAPMISAPVNMFDAAPIADGAAALMLVRADAMPESIPQPRIRISASSASITAVSIHDRPDPLTLTAVNDSSREAYAIADSKPEDIHLFELHDRFSIFAALSLEAAGFATRGEGWRLAKNDAITRDGDIPICTFGGSKARGDPGGATGVYQLAEVTLQLQGRAGRNQVPNARIGMAQCLGGTGATVATHILERIEGS